MSGQGSQHAAMLERLERYAALRQGGAKPHDAILQLGMASSAAARYERWYRGRLGLPDRPDHDWRFWWTR